MLANANDRASVERVYPIGEFSVDAAANAKQPANELLRGVRVLSAPDEAGAFEIERWTKHVGEVHGEAFFAADRTLCGLHVFAALYQPLAGSPGALAMSRTGQPYAVANPDPREESQTFIDGIIAAAHLVGFRQNESPGFGDARLQGLRQ